jgi:uncharacterized damage-inducible protein DinB
VQEEPLSASVDILQPNNSYNVISADRVDEHLRHVVGVVEHFISMLTDLKTQAITEADWRQQMKREANTAKAHSQAKDDQVDAKFDQLDARLQELEQHIAAQKVRSDIAVQYTHFISWLASLCEL